MSVLRALVFVSLAGAAHLGAAALYDAAPGSFEPAGAGGADALSLAALPAGLQPLIETWDQPPEASQTPTALQAPAPDAPFPRVRQPVALLPAPAQAPAQAPLPAPATDALPWAETRPPAPGTVVSSDQIAALPSPPQPVSDLLMRPWAKGTSRPTPPVEPPVARPDPPPALQAVTPEAMPQVDQSPALPGSRMAPATSARPQARDPAAAARTVAAKPAAKPAPQRAAKPATQSARSGQTASSPKRTAQGQGDSARSGSGTATRAAPGPSAAQIARAEAEWAGRIQRAIARQQRYPGGTRDRGRVTLRITLSPAGGLQGASIVASSGSAALDRAAMQAVQRARYPRAPGGLTKSSYSFRHSLNFSR